MNSKAWTGNLLPSSLRKNLISQTQALPKRGIYYDQSVLRVLMREEESSANNQFHKQTLGMPVSKNKFTLKLILTPIFMQELLGIKAPNPLLDPIFKFDRLNTLTTTLDLLKSVKKFNLNNIRIKNSSELIQIIQTNYLPSYFRQKILNYLNEPEEKIHATLAEHWAFQSIQEKQLHPKGQTPPFDDLVKFSFIHREHGTNLSLFRLFTHMVENDFNLPATAKTDEILAKIKELKSYKTDKKLFLDHSDFEYVHLAVAGFASSGISSPTICFTHDCPDIVRKRYSLYKYFYNLVHNLITHTLADDEMILPITEGHIICLKNNYEIADIIPRKF